MAPVFHELLLVAAVGYIEEEIILFEFRTDDETKLVDNAAERQIHSSSTRYQV